MAGVDVCEANNRAIENMEIMHTQGADKDKFFYCNLDIPYSDDEDCVEHICEQVSRKILKPMRENYGVDTSDAAIRTAVSEAQRGLPHPHRDRRAAQVGYPPITGYEYAVLVLVSYTCPKRLILPYLHETLEEIKSRKTDTEKDYRVRVAVVGSEIDDPDLIRLIESCGALVVADRYCYGSFPAVRRSCLRTARMHSRRCAAGTCSTPSARARVRCTASSTAMTTLPSSCTTSRPTARSTNR